MAIPQRTWPRNLLIVLAVDCMVLNSVALAWAPPPAGGESPPTAAIVDQSPEIEDAGREMVAQSLVDLGRSVDAAELTASLLTEADLAVLGANPGMLQPAALVQGEMIILIVLGAAVAVMTVLYFQERDDREDAEDRVDELEMQLMN